MSFFSVEQEIRDRLVACMPQLKAVFLSDSTAALATKTPTITPAAYISYTGYSEPPEAKRGGVALILEQTWVVILVTRNVSNQLYTSIGGKDNAGVLLEGVIGCLLNWTPPSTYRGLRLTAAPNPMYSGEGVDFYPVAFTSAKAIKSIPQ